MRSLTLRKYGLPQQRMDVQHADEHRVVRQPWDGHLGVSFQPRERHARHAERDAQILPRRHVIHLRLYQRRARRHGQAAQLRGS